MDKKRFAEVHVAYEMSTIGQDCSQQPQVCIRTFLSAEEQAWIAQVSGSPFPEDGELCPACPCASTFHKLWVKQDRPGRIAALSGCTVLTRDQVDLRVLGTFPLTARWTVNRWLARGDGIAVYTNKNMGSPDLGAMQIVSYGSGEAQLETDAPPARMPDIGGSINYAYWLTGVYEGEAL